MCIGIDHGIDEMQNQKDLTGKRYGKLTVLHKLTETENGYCVWLCRCDCGGTIKVSTKKLNRGTITNCGCIPKSNQRRGQLAENLTGRRFGKLVVVRRVANKRGRTAWECRCDCGNTYITTAKELKDGKCKSCGCLKHQKYQRMADISGQTFGRLTAEYPIERRDKKGSIYWHCRCSCGDEIDVTEDDLVHGNYRSCGCYRKEEIWDKIPQQLHFIDGTCLEAIEKRKHRCDNKSGFRGVFRLKNGKYRVTIGFKRKTFYIATVGSLDDAIQARMKVEKIVHDGFVAAYYEWKKETETVPEDQRKPFKYDITKVNGEFIVSTNISCKYT